MKIQKFINKGFFFTLILAHKMAQAQGIGNGDSVISPPAGAGSLPTGGVTGTDIKSSFLFSKLIPFLISWGINLAIGLSVLMVIVGGYQFLTAYGNEEKHTQGIKTLVYSFIGLGLSLAAYAIVQIITRIQFS